MQDEFDVALENNIFEWKIISSEKGDKDYGIELTAHFTKKYGIFNLVCKITYVPLNDIQGDTLDKLICNFNIDLSQFLRKISVVENTQDTVF